MYIEEIRKLGYNEGDLKIRKIEPLMPKNFDKVIGFMDDLKSNKNHRCLIQWDVDVDGKFAGYIGYNMMKEFVPISQLDNYVNETKIHGITWGLVDYCKHNLITHLVIVDAGTNDVDEIKYLNNMGVRVLVIDHHVKTKEYISDDFVLVNSHDLDFGQYVSGAYLTNEVMKLLYTYYTKAYLNTYDEMAVVSIVSDMCDKDDPYNKNVILHFICGKFRNTEIINLFRKPYTKNTLPFIVSITSSLNAIIRFHGSRFLMDLMLRDTLKLKSILNNIKTIKEENESIILEIIRKSKIFEMDSLLVVVLNDSLPDKGVIIRNYLGIIASKLCNAYKKMCVVLGNKNINYENTTGYYKYCFSARDYFKRNSLAIAIESGIEADGHDQAWGGYLGDNFTQLLNSFNRGLQASEIIPNTSSLTVTDITEFINDIKEIETPLSLWNSVASDEKKIKVEFNLVGQIVTQNKIKKVLYKNHLFKSFESELSLNDRVHLILDFNGEPEYFLKKA